MPPKKRVKRPHVEPPRPWNPPPEAVLYQTIDGTPAPDDYVPSFLLDLIAGNIREREGQLPSSGTAGSGKRSVEAMAQTVVDQKLKGQQVSLDNPMPEISAKDAEKRSYEQKHKARNKLRKKMAPFVMEKKDFYSLVPLHNLWKQYIEDIIKDAQGADIGEILLKADFHGCLMTICRSRIPELVGLTGIMIQETENVFRIVLPNGDVKSIAKAHSVFSIVAHDQLISIYGDNFRYRSHDRSARKFKNKIFIDL